MLKLSLFQKPPETAPSAPEDAPEKNNTEASTEKIAEVEAANKEKDMNGGGDELKELRGLKRDVSLSTSSSGDSTETVIFVVEGLFLKCFKFFLVAESEKGAQQAETGDD